MKILLLGEYSNLHYTLAHALRELGHEVRQVSDGDDWKRYPQDVRLARKSTGKLDTLRYLLQLRREMRRWRGYDVVQLINPVHFIDLKAGRGMRIYDYLRRHNAKVFLGAFGDDYYYIHDSYVNRRLRYCDFYTPTHEVCHDWNRSNIAGWLENQHMVEACRHVAQTCNGIIAALYEYYEAYRPLFPRKTVFIPLPVALPGQASAPAAPSGKLRFFIGIQARRSALKGTDILLRVARELEQEYPDRMQLVTAQNLPFDQYTRLMATCDVLLDQIYSYTPAMNALQAMAGGIVAVSGGEKEQYELLGEHELRPIINVQPDETDIRRQLEDLILHPERLPELKRQSIEYIRRHHDATKVARQYVRFWQQEQLRC